MEILDDISLSIKIKDNVKQQISEKFSSYDKPLLECIIVEGNKASETYVLSKQKACDYCGISSRITKLSQNTTQQQLEQKNRNVK